MPRRAAASRQIALLRPAEAAAMLGMSRRTLDPPDWCANRAALRSARIPLNFPAVSGQPKFFPLTKSRTKWALSARSGRQSPEQVPNSFQVRLRGLA